MVENFIQTRTFSNEFTHNDVKYLPTSSYYQITDLNSNDIIIPFGDYSKLSSLRHLPMVIILKLILKILKSTENIKLNLKLKEVVL